MSRRSSTCARRLPQERLFSIKGRWLISIACALLVCSAPAHAGFCADLLASTKTYLSEVRRSKGVRLFVAPERERVPVNYLGFISERGWPAPLNGLNHVLVDVPTDAAVRRVAGPGKQAGFWLKMPVMVTWLVLGTVYVYEPVTDFAFNQRIESQIEQNQAVFDRLIEEDFRFDSIRRRLSAALITKEEAEREAYMVSRAYASYFKYRDGKGAQFSDEDNEGLLNHYLFGHLKPLLSADIPVIAGFRVTPAYTPRLNLERKRQLFKLTHRLYLQYQVIEAYVNGRTDAALLSAHNELRALPFTQQLEEWQREGRISKGQMHRALQERAFWEYRLKSYEVVGLERQHPDSGEPVTLNDYVAEILASLSSNR